MSHETMMKMHYPTFFKYVREVEEKLRKQKAQQGNQQQDSLPTELQGAQLANVAGRPVVWGGDVVDVSQQ